MDHICPKRALSSLKQKSEYLHWILYIRISLGTKFQLKLTILSFLTKFIQKGYFPSKKEKVNVITEFCIFKLTSVPNFRLKVTSATKLFFCHKVALDVQLMNVFIWSKNNISFTRYLDFCVYVKPTNFKICDVIISIAT